MGLWNWHEDWLKYKKIVYGNSDFCSWRLHFVDVLRCISPEAINTGTWADSAGKSGTFGEFSWGNEVLQRWNQYFYQSSPFGKQFVQHNKIWAL